MRSILIIVALILTSLQIYGIRTTGWVPTKAAPVSIQARIDYARMYGKRAITDVIDIESVTGPGVVVYGWWMEDYRFYALPVPLIGTIYGPYSHLEAAAECRNPVEFAGWVRDTGATYLIIDWSRRRTWASYCDMKGLPHETDHRGWERVKKDKSIEIWKIIL